MRGALFISLGLLGLSTILIILVLIAGINKHVLVDWFYLKANTGALSVSAKLSNSTYLKDLSKISGTDLVGANATASSLGIGDWTTISLFTACTNTGSSINCTTPHFGFSFHPSTGLKLDSTGLQGSGGLVSIPSYGHLSAFLGVAYILALILTAFTKGLNILSCCFPRAIAVSAFTSVAATIFLLAASSAALGIFVNLKGKFDSGLVSTGIKTALGSKPFIISWIATVLMLLNSILLCVSHRNNKQGRQRGLVKGVGLIDHTGMDKGVGVESFAAPKIKRTRTLQLLKKVGTWRSQKYTQIEKQAAVRGIPEDEYIMNRSGFGGIGPEDDDDGDLARNSTRVIPLQPFGNSQKRDSAAAYEPYRHAG